VQRVLAEDRQFDEAAFERGVTVLSGIGLQLSQN
jgi:hypothetical protein